MNVNLSDRLEVITMKTQTPHAQRFLLAKLSTEYWTPRADVIEEAQEHGFSADQIRRAAESLDVQRSRDGFQGKALWKLYGGEGK